jgi:hypothetical protein
MFNVKSVVGSTKASSALDLSLVAEIPVAMSPITDAGGSGGGGAAPHCISPAKAEEASTNVKTATAQSWRRCFISFLLKCWLRIAAGDEAKPTIELSGRIIPYRVNNRALLILLQIHRKVNLT